VTIKPASEMTDHDLGEVCGQVADFLDQSVREAVARPLDPANPQQRAQAEIVNQLLGVVWDQKVQALRRAKEKLQAAPVKQETIQ